MGIPIEIDSTPESDWIFRHEPVECGVVIAGTVKVQSGPVIFTPGVLKGIRARRTCRARSAERLVGVLRPNGARGIRQCDGRSERVDQEGTRPARVSSHEVFIDTETG